MLRRNRYDPAVEIVSTVEIAKLLGLSRQRVDKLSRGDRFPEPVADLAIGRVWSRAAVVEWAKQTGRLPANFDE
jgi:predicted DNA-binding transcriptional regulator AlpA